MKHIGITTSQYEWPSEEANQLRLQRYLDAVADAGAVGEYIWLPRDESSIANRQSSIEKLDGLIVSGGADLPAAMYGAEDIAEANAKFVPPARPALELALIPEFLNRGKPVLGICYGCQLFNVWHGGTLIQDIPLQRPNSINHKEGHHEVRLERGSFLHEIIAQDAFEITTSHHQAIEQVASSATLAATAPDGIVEAIELSRAPFFLGVQWHPECDRETEATRRLFEAFVGTK